MISERYKTFSDFEKVDKELIQKGYEQYFKNKHYFNLIDEMSIIEYDYDNFRIFVCDNADVIITFDKKIIGTLFTTELSSIKVDNKNNILAFVSWEFDFVLIDFKSRKIYNSTELI